MPDDCTFERSDPQVVVDTNDPKVEIHYLFYRCLLIEETGDKCPFEKRCCNYKIDNDELTVEGSGMQFRDGSVLEDLGKIEEL
ncbi:MAG: hypothetical protein M0Q91_07585 [Methanoregula sp.]|jgi:hypothetical protein|nr:hypothetical protein [Methanoregula sp.]